VEGHVDVRAGLSVGAELHGRAHDDGAVVVGGTVTLTPSIQRIFKGSS